MVRSDIDPGPRPFLERLEQHPDPDRRRRLPRVHQWRNGAHPWSRAFDPVAAGPWSDLRTQWRLHASQPHHGRASSRWGGRRRVAVRTQMGGIDHRRLQLADHGRLDGRRRRFGELCRGPQVGFRGQWRDYQRLRRTGAQFHHPQRKRRRDPRPGHLPGLRPQHRQFARHRLRAGPGGPDPDQLQHRLGHSSAHLRRSDHGGFLRGERDPDMPAGLSGEVADRLRAIVGDRLHLGEAIRAAHGRSESHFAMSPPDAVAFPHSTEEVVGLVRACLAADVAIIPFGAGTSIEGNTTPVRGGVTIDLSEMDRIVAVNAEDFDCTVEAGVRREQLNGRLKGTGLFFPIDPGANATIGGMAATRASGTNAVRYGTMRENVMGLTVITAEGDVVHTGGRARKSSAGYDLTRLYVGSEGTLGIITEIQLRLYGLPEAILAAVCQFPDLASATHTVITAMQMGIPVARIELLDDVQMDACIRYSKLEGFDVKPTLFFEFHGSDASAHEQAELMQQIAAEHDGSAFRWASATEERNKLWKARHNAYYAVLALKPGFQAFATDACVPISRLADCLLETRADVEREGMLAPIVGHVGDGNFHLVLLFDPKDPRERQKAEAIAQRVSVRAIAMGGTCTGEHGIGVHKLDALVTEHGEGAVDLMRRIKRALDPLDILNPGKTVPMQTPRQR